MALCPDFVKSQIGDNGAPAFGAYPPGAAQMGAVQILQAVRDGRLFSSRRKARTMTPVIAI